MSSERKPPEGGVKVFPPPAKPVRGSFKGLPAGQFLKRHPQRSREAYRGTGSNRVFRPIGRGR